MEKVNAVSAPFAFKGQNEIWSFLENAFQGGGAVRVVLFQGSDA